MMKVSQLLVDNSATQFLLQERVRLKLGKKEPTLSFVKKWSHKATPTGKSSTYTVYEEATSSGFNYLLFCKDLIVGEICFEEAQDFFELTMISLLKEHRGQGLIQKLFSLMLDEKPNFLYSTNVILPVRGNNALRAFRKLFEAGGIQAWTYPSIDQPSVVIENTKLVDTTILKNNEIPNSSKFLKDHDEESLYGKIVFFATQEKQLV